MDYNSITTVISAVGFPIVACGALFWNQITMQKQHEEEISQLREVINANTLALVELRDAVGGIKHD